jgi:hypothetical protein
LDLLENLWLADIIYTEINGPPVPLHFYYTNAQDSETDSVVKNEK